ncbi:MAG: lytic transglycosylase domain-containing protein, partial [Arenimonas sp.]
MNSLGKLLLLATVLGLSWAPAPAAARVIYRCTQGGTVSLATAPEPGSKCKPQTVDDNAAKLPNLWGLDGTQKGTLYEREQDGKTVYSTRKLPGSIAVLQFAVTPPPGSPVHAGLGQVGKPRTGEHAATFVAAAKANHIEDAWLRAIAHAESGFRSNAVSNKGAQGIMQLLPATARAYDVKDPFSASDSIRGGARLLSDLLRRYKGDRQLAAAAYNAGIGAVAKYGGVPPYAETRAY